jgi:hypothetical protein
MLQNFPPQSAHDCDKSSIYFHEDGGPPHCCTGVHDKYLKTLTKLICSTYENLPPLLTNVNDLWATITGTTAQVITGKLCQA